MLENIKYTFDYSYCGSGALEYGLFASLIVATICFVLTKLTTEYSWVDRIWSTLPPAYALHFWYHQTHCRNIPFSDRQWLMLILTLIWGARLTFNFIRKGGYKKGGEDYRWAYIRKTQPWILVELLNFFFTAYYQLVLIYWFSTPIFFAQPSALNTVDYILAALTFGMILMETVADQQQWNYQTVKYELINSKKISQPGNEKYKLGFLTSGLFRYSRHPNFFAEQAIWWLMFFFSVNAVGLNYSGYGALQLTLLFQGSTALTEKISCEKYPIYKKYKQNTSRIIPLPAPEFDVRTN